MNTRSCAIVWLVLSCTCFARAAVDLRLVTRNLDPIPGDPSGMQFSRLRSSYAALSGNHDVYFMATRTPPGGTGYDDSLYRWTSAGGDINELVRGTAGVYPRLTIQTVIANSIGDVAYYQAAENGSHQIVVRQADGSTTVRSNDYFPLQLTDSGYLLTKSANGGGQPNFLISPSGVRQPIDNAVTVRPNPYVAGMEDVGALILATRDYENSRHIRFLDNQLHAGGRGYFTKTALPGYNFEDVYMSVGNDYSTYQTISRVGYDPQAWQIFFNGKLDDGSAVFWASGPYLGQKLFKVNAANTTLTELLPASHYVPVQDVADLVQIDGITAVAGNGALAGIGHRAFETNTKGVYVQTIDGIWHEISRQGQTIPGFGVLGSSLDVHDVMYDGSVLFMGNDTSTVYARDGLFVATIPEPTAGLALLLVGFAGLHRRIRGRVRSLQR